MIASVPSHGFRSLTAFARIADSHRRFFIPRIGAVASGLLALALFASPANAQGFIPSNDECAGALPLADGQNLWDNNTATNSTGPAPCATLLEDIWFTYTASCTGTAKISLCGQSPAVTLDTVIQVMTATSTCGSLTQLACNDQGPCGNPSEVNFPVSSGSTYIVRLGSFTAATSSGSMTVSCSPPPINDVCAGATVIGSTPYTAPAASLNGPAAGNDLDVTCNSSTPTSTISGVWFTYTPGTNGVGSLTQTSSNDTVMAVFTGSCAGLTQVLCSDPNTATIAMTSGTQYWILIGMWGSTAPTTNYGFTFDFLLPPPNDTCAGAAVIGSTPYTAPALNVNGQGATNDLDVTCNTAAVTTNGVWFTYTPGANGTGSLAETSANDTVMAVFTGSCAGLTQVACSDPESTSVAMTSGTQYWILVGMVGAVAPTAPYGFTFDFAVPPPNDTCGTAIPLTLDIPVTGTTAGGTNDYQLIAASPAFTGVGQTASTCLGKDVVYTFTAPSAGTYSFRVNGYSTTQNVVLFTASSCPGGAPPITVATALQAANRNSTNGAEEVMCQSMIAGETVYVYVDDNVTANAGSAFTIQVNSCTRETEANSTPATANTYSYPMETSVGTANDPDFFALGTPDAGSRLFAMIDNLAGNTGDTKLWVTTSVDTLEFDDDDGDVAFGASGFESQCMGTPLTGVPAYLRFAPFSTTLLSEPHRISAVIQPPIGSAKLESEPNDTTPQANSGSGYYSGTLTASSDVDFYAFTATAGQMIFLGADCDPLRNNTPIDLTLALFNSTPTQLISVNGSGATSSTTASPGTLIGTTPNSPGEGLLFRVVTSGTYYARVTGLTAGDYLLSISVLPYCAAGSLACNTATDEYISNATIGTINNTTTSGTGCYNDYSTQSSSMQVAVGDTLTVTNGNAFAGDQATAWVDWNSNGSFSDAGEQFTLSGGPAVFSGSIIPPLATSLGPKRMRVRVQGAGAVSPCGNTATGEVEDYTVTVTAPPAPPANDGCSAAIAVTDGTTPGTTFLSTYSATDGTSTCDPTGNDVWYSYTAAITGTLSIRTCTSAIDTVVSVYPTPCGSGPIACNDDCGGSPCGAPASCLSIGITSGSTYLIRVSGKSIGTGGAFNLILSAALANDDCTGATTVAVPSATSATTVGATSELGSTPSPCTGPGAAEGGGNFGVTSASIWYKVNVASSQTLYADTLTASYDTKLHVYTGTCGALSCVTVNDDVISTFRSKVAWQANGGQDYYILVGGFGTGTGTFTLNVTGDPTPSNDLCSSATTISGISGSFVGTNVGATGDASGLTSAGLASCTANYTYWDTWCSYTPDCTASYTIATCGTFDTDVSVYTACPTFTVSNQLTPTASSCNDDGPAGCTPGSSVTVSLSAGSTYLIRVATDASLTPAAGGGQAYTLTWSTPDGDLDGTPDACDGCPTDPNKIAPGICGCNVSDVDTDGDTVADCIDGCPNNPALTAPATWYRDLDGDGFGDPADTTLACSQPVGYVANSGDGCPTDPNKIAPGQCGCGIADTDNDNDGTANCNDGCPNDPNKITPGVCGCGVADTDVDSDGHLDCLDNCPSIANANQLDFDSDGHGDACDNCERIANPGQEDCNNDGVGDVCAIAAGSPDCNSNSVPDTCDIAGGASQDANGNTIPDECEQNGGTPFCFGDTGCPCGNTSATSEHAGCRNSSGLGGKLVGSGNTSLSLDTLTLQLTDLQGNPGLAIIFQSSAVTSGVFHADGKRCWSGPLIRFDKSVPNPAGSGTAVYPTGSQPPVSQVQPVLAPGVRYYQAVYRNAQGSPCGTGLNVTNALSVVWSL